MPSVFLDKPPLQVPSALGLSDRTKDYDDLPPTPPGLPEHSLVRTVRQVRELVPRQLVELLSAAIDTSDADDLPCVVSGWAAFAGRLHDPEYQATVDLLEEDRLDELIGEEVVQEPPVADTAPCPPPAGQRVFFGGREAVWVDE
ncbi:hypothetical protein [Allokutzneria sp. NRRL B-24872]|uniref:hypothetical protein n=1 Tax=Allokutzneria sp. NRRL B-24872 TaxID=1137961 RepID=UPI0011778D54|nr:hypothetical protein [Allokutzneria sp. NRRL B-24872]